LPIAYKIWALHPAELSQIFGCDAMVMSMNKIAVYVDDIALTTKDKGSQGNY